MSEDHRLAEKEHPREGSCGAGQRAHRSSLPSGDVTKAWVLVLQLGIGVLVPIGLCIAAGLLLDRCCGIRITVVLLVVGILAGLNSAWHLLKGLIGEDDEETKLLTGIYDRADGADAQEEEDDLLEDLQENNRRREVR